MSRDVDVAVCPSCGQPLPAQPDPEPEQDPFAALLTDDERMRGVRRMHEDEEAEPEPATSDCQHGLTFEALREANVHRATESYGHDWRPESPTGDEWRPTDWACATAGELGEACNLIKKRRRGEAVPLEDIAHELADTVIYLDLLAHSLGINLAEAVVRKFDIVSDRVGSNIKLGRPEIREVANFVASHLPERIQQPTPA